MRCLLGMITRRALSNRELPGVLVEVSVENSGPVGDGLKLKNIRTGRPPTIPTRTQTPRSKCLKCPGISSACDGESNGHEATIRRKAG